MEYQSSYPTRPYRWMYRNFNNSILGNQESNISLPSNPPSIGDTGICLCSIIVYFGLLFSAAGAELARSKMYDIEAKWPVGRHELAEMVRRDTMSDSTVSCSN